MVILSLIFVSLIAEFFFRPIIESRIGKEEKVKYILFTIVFFALYSLTLFSVTKSWLLISFIAVTLHIILDLLEDKFKLKSFELPIFLTKQLAYILLVSLFIYLIKVPLFSGNSAQIARMYIAIGFILIIIFAVKFIDVIYAQSLIFSKTRVIEKKYKILSTCERVVLFLLLMFGFYYFVPLIFIPRIYYQRAEVLTKYRTDLLIGTTFTALVFIFLTKI